MSYVRTAEIREKNRVSALKNCSNTEYVLKRKLGQQKFLNSAGAKLRNEKISEKMRLAWRSGKFRLETLFGGKYYANTGRTRFAKGNVPWNSGLSILSSRKLKNSIKKSVRSRIQNGSQRREKHYNWKGGLSFMTYPEEFSLTLKKKILERDLFICQLCGMTNTMHRRKYARNLCVNHINFNKTDCREDNLNALCISCNFRVNFDREKYTALFSEKLLQQTKANFQ